MWRFTIQNSLNPQCSNSLVTKPNTIVGQIEVRLWNVKRLLTASKDSFPFSRPRCLCARVGVSRMAIWRRSLGEPASCAELLAGALPDWSPQLNTASILLQLQSHNCSQFSHRQHTKLMKENRKQYYLSILYNSVFDCMKCMGCMRAPRRQAGVLVAQPASTQPWLARRPTTGFHRGSECGRKSFTP